jgi:hypothetical protein
LYEIGNARLKHKERMPAVRFEAHAPGLPDDVIVLDYATVGHEDLAGFQNQEMIFVGCTVKLNQVTFFYQVDRFGSIRGHCSFRVTSSG